MNYLLKDLGLEAATAEEIQLGKEQVPATIKELYAYQEKVQRAYIECLGSVKQHLGQWEFLIK